MSNSRVSLVLFLSIAAISTAAILVRLVPEMHPIAIAFWRTAIVALLLMPTWYRAGAVRPKGKQILWTVIAGLCLAFHFWTWFASLQLTSVLRSTVLVCLTPVWAGLLAWLAFSEPPNRRFWGGIGIALIGVACMAMGGENQGDQPSWTGDLLALTGGILSGTYLTIGRAVRPHVDWGPYGALVCASCAGWLLGFSLITDASLAVLGSSSWWIIAAMALGPQFIGHIGFTWAVRFVPAYIIGAVILLEPVGATALGTVVLDEWPTVTEVLGAAVIMLGVLGATIRRRPAQAKTPNQSG
jgi:drug/metabolite transporter (DMT)-like permease